MLRDGTLLARQNSGSNCVPCSEPPPCSCTDSETCIRVNRDCFQCDSYRCVPKAGSKKSSGINTGALAGGVVAAVVLVVALVLLYFWFRRRSAAASRGTQDPPIKDTPARAEDVLNRPDPNEKPPSPIPIIPNVDPPAYPGHPSDDVGSSNIGTQGHTYRYSSQSDPFRDRLLDNHSIQTAGSLGQASNLIPIALVGPDGSSGISHPGALPSHPAVGGFSQADPALFASGDDRDSLRAPAPLHASASSSLRYSYLSTGSFASDLLGEAPIIVTPAVKQVVGVVKAEVIRTAPSSAAGDSPPVSADSLRPTFTRRPTLRSPLASSFGPSDTVSEVDEDRGYMIDVKVDPFADENRENSRRTHATSPVPSNNTLTPTVAITSPYSPGIIETPTTGDWVEDQDYTRLGRPRPDSVGTQVGSVISASIGAATRMNVAQILTPHSTTQDTPVSATLSTPRTPYRVASAKLVQPLRGGGMSPVSPSGGAFEMQQRRALEELDAARRESRASVATNSTRADSILESFPFVPPSPISDRPLRTPPRSPLGQPGFGAARLNIPPVPTLPPSLPPSPRESNGESQAQAGSIPQVGGSHPDSNMPERARKKSNNQPPPPAIMNNRRTLGLSVASEISTMSNGLGAFHFQIDNATLSDAPPSYVPPQGDGHIRQRASLDTLALTSDLTSYGLAMDPELQANYPGPRR